MEYKAKVKGKVNVYHTDIPIETTITINAETKEEAEAIALRAVKGAYVGWSSWEII